jgi:alkylhydroperoxidase family enzyme
MNSLRTAHEEVKQQFEPANLSKLSVLAAAINVWNRISIGLRLVHPSEKKKSN